MQIDLSVTLVGCRDSQGCERAPWAQPRRHRHAGSWAKAGAHRHLLAATGTESDYIGITYRSRHFVHVISSAPAASACLANPSCAHASAVTGKGLIRSLAPIWNLIQSHIIGLQASWHARDACTLRYGLHPGRPHSAAELSSPRQAGGRWQPFIRACPALVINDDGCTTVV